MIFEDLEIIWRDENAHPTHTIDDEALRQIVLERARNYRRDVFWKDAMDIGIHVGTAVLLVGVCLWTLNEIGKFTQNMISMLVIAAAYLFASAFRWIGGQRQKAREANFDDSLRGNLEKLVANADYHIRLQQNYLWWYLVPVLPGYLLLAASFWSSGPEAFWFMTISVIALFSFVHWGNNQIVRTKLIPQKEELESQLAGLENGGKSAEIRGSSKRTTTDELSLRRRCFGLGLALLILGMAIAFLVKVFWPVQQLQEPDFEDISAFAKVAPFSAIRWENDQPIVRVEDRWSPLISIDDIPIEEIMEHARKEFGDQAQMRFGEDLPRVLSSFGHAPKWEVTLGLQAEDGQMKQLKVKMTEANRTLIRDKRLEHQN